MKASVLFFVPDRRPTEPGFWGRRVTDSAEIPHQEAPLSTYQIYGGTEATAAPAISEYSGKSLHLGDAIPGALEQETHNPLVHHMAEA